MCWSCHLMRCVFFSRTFFPQLCHVTWCNAMSCDARSCEDLSSVVPRNGMECYELKTPLFSKELLCTAKYYSSTTPYYKVLLQYYSSIKFNPRRTQTVKTIPVRKSSLKNCSFAIWKSTFGTSSRLLYVEGILVYFEYIFLYFVKIFLYFEGIPLYIKVVFRKYIFLTSKIYFCTSKVLWSHNFALWKLLCTFAKI